VYAGCLRFTAGGGRRFKARRAAAAEVVVGLYGGVTGDGGPLWLL